MNQHPNDFVIRALANRGIDHPELLDLQEIQKLCEFVSKLIEEPLDERLAPAVLQAPEAR